MASIAQSKNRALFRKAGIATTITMLAWTMNSTGYIIWIRGSFPAGKWNDVKVFDRDLLTHILLIQIKKCRTIFGTGVSRGEVFMT